MNGKIISGFFFHRFSLNSRRSKLKIFSKLKDFLLNSINYVPKLKNLAIFIKFREKTQKLHSFCLPKLKIFTVNSRICPKLKNPGNPFAGEIKNRRKKPDIHK